MDRCHLPAERPGARTGRSTGPERGTPGNQNGRWLALLPPPLLGCTGTLPSWGEGQGADWGPCSHAGPSQPRKGGQHFAPQPPRCFRETAGFPRNCRVGLWGLILAFSEVSLALVKHNRSFLPWRGALLGGWFSLAAHNPLVQRVSSPPGKVCSAAPLPTGPRQCLRSPLGATPAPPMLLLNTCSVVLVGSLYFLRSLERHAGAMRRGTDLEAG